MDTASGLLRVSRAVACDRRMADAEAVCCDLHFGCKVRVLIVLLYLTSVLLCAGWLVMILQPRPMWEKSFFFFIEMFLFRPGPSAQLPSMLGRLACEFRQAYSSGPWVLLIFVTSYLFCENCAHCLASWLVRSRLTKIFPGLLDLLACEFRPLLFFFMAELFIKFRLGSSA